MIGYGKEQKEEVKGEGSPPIIDVELAKESAERLKIRRVDVDFSGSGVAGLNRRPADLPAGLSP